jgi:hypothetical protein
MTSGDEYLEKLHVLREQEYERRRKKGMNIKEYLEEIKNISHDFPVKSHGLKQNSEVV